MYDLSFQFKIWLFVLRKIFYIHNLEVKCMIYHFNSKFIGKVEYDI